MRDVSKLDEASGFCRSDEIPIGTLGGWALSPVVPGAAEIETCLAKRRCANGRAHASAVVKPCAHSD